METTIMARSGVPFEGSAFHAPVYRIPALAVTASGRVLAAYDVRLDWRDLPGDFDIALRHSDDHGRTWSDPRALRRHTPGHGYGDASFVVAPSGHILCWYVGSTGRSFFSAEAGPDAPGLELWLSHSDDDGATWTHREMTALKPADVTGMFASSGNGTVTASGRLLQPFVLRTASGEHFAAIAHSDDDGETWTLGERVGPDCDENKVLGLPDGSVLLHARATPRRRTARSTDGGVTFTDPVPDAALVDPACNGGLALLAGPDAGRPVVVASTCDDPTERTRLSVRTSLDDGRTWSDPVLVDAGASAYSVCVPLADGSLGLAWEAGDYDEIVFARIDVDEAGRVEVEPRAGRPGAAKPPEVAG